MNKEHLDIKLATNQIGFYKIKINAIANKPISKDMGLLY